MKPVQARIAATWSATPDALMRLVEAILRKRMGNERYDAYQAKLKSDAAARRKSLDEQARRDMEEHMKKFNEFLSIRQQVNDAAKLLKCKPDEVIIRIVELKCDLAETKAEIERIKKLLK